MRYLAVVQQMPNFEDQSSPRRHGAVARTQEQNRVRQIVECSEIGTGRRFGSEKHPLHIVAQLDERCSPAHR